MNNDYTPLTSDKMKNKISRILDLWKGFLESSISEFVEEYNNLTNKHITTSSSDEITEINYTLLNEVFERSNQRMDYYNRYHDNLKMSNFKEIGVIAFWIVKLKPFHVKCDVYDEVFSYRINEEFALYFMFNSVFRYIELKNEEYNKARISVSLYNELLYTMQFRDLSKEAYGCIVELIYAAVLK